MPRRAERYSWGIGAARGIPAGGNVAMGDGGGGTDAGRIGGGSGSGAVCCARPSPGVVAKAGGKGFAGCQDGGGGGFEGYPELRPKGEFALDGGGGGRVGGRD